MTGPMADAMMAGGGPDRAARMDFKGSGKRLLAPVQAGAAHARTRCCAAVRR